MPFGTRVAAFWLGACSLGVGMAFLRYMQALEYYQLSWNGHAILLFASAALGLYISLTGSPRRWATGALIGGHLAAMISTNQFLAGRPHSYMNFAPEYLLPDATGALILFGPSVAVVLWSTLHDS
jgi:hypothetical protein